jgi:DNA-binding transcriptional LysR family regulator
MEPVCSKIGNNMNRLSAIESFVKVAELNSFSEAAARLNTSKSVVSRHVTALEAQLGLRLFHRTTRAITLTEAGRAYFERVSQILLDLQDADQSVSHLQVTPRGRLKVSAPMSFGFLHLAPALADFLAEYPELEVDVTMSDRFVDLVEDGFDLAVRIGTLADSSFIAKRIAPIRRVICASPSYLEAHGTPAVPQDLRAHQCLCNSNQPAGREWRFTMPDGNPVSVPVNGRLAMNNGDALRVAALNHLGFIDIPTFIVGGDLKAGTLVSVLDDHVPQVLALHAVYSHARHLSPKVRAFIDFLARRFGPRPYWDLGE